MISPDWREDRHDMISPDWREDRHDMISTDWRKDRHEIIGAQVFALSHICDLASRSRSVSIKI